MWLKRCEVVGSVHRRGQSQQHQDFPAKRLLTRRGSAWWFLTTREHGQRLYACLHTYMLHRCRGYAHARTWADAWTCAYMHEFMHACMDSCMHGFTHTWMDSCMQPCMHTFCPALMHASVHLCVHACVHVCMHAFMCARLHAYSGCSVRGSAPAYPQLHRQWCQVHTHSR